MHVNHSGICQEDVKMKGRKVHHMQAFMPVKQQTFSIATPEIQPAFLLFFCVEVTK